MRKTVERSVLLACMLAYRVVSAQEFSPSASVWVGHTDNPLAIYRPPESTYYTDLNAGIVYVHEGTRSSAEADLRVVRRDYQGADIKGVTLPAGRVELDYHLVSDHLRWVIEDTVGQVSVRPYEALSNPDRATLNVFSTGPNVQLKLGDSGYLLGEARIGRSHFNQMNLDSKEYGGSLTIGRELSPASKLGLNISSHATDYGRLAGGNRTFQNAYLTLALLGARTELDIAAGIASVETVGNPRQSAPSFRLTLSRQASARLVTGMDYYRGYSESTQSFVREATTGTGNPGETALDVTSAPFLSESYRLHIVKGEGRFDIGARAGYSKENYAGGAGAPLTGDRRSLDGGLALEYQLSSSFQLVTDFQATRYRTLGTQTVAASTQQAWAGTAGLLGQISRSMGVGLLFVYSKGDADSGQSRNFIERRIIAGIAYEPRSSKPRLYDPMRNFRRFQAQATARLPKNRIPAP